MARCPQCDFANPTGFRFCGHCGKALLSAVAAPTEERKVVSALFCDLVNFTQRAERLDPEDVHRVLSPYFASLRSELERFGGTVEKFIGDAVVGLFGAPRAHQDDPERAVRAALAIRDAVTDLNGVEPTLDLHIRIGVTTGEVVVALGARPKQGEGMAWGDVLNTSSRLQHAAPTDGILVDEATYRVTRDTIEYAEAEPVHAKGKAEPILVWEALAPRSRPGLHLALGGKEPFVGRRDELASLLEALDRSRRQRTPEFVTIVGEPGIGKSRLVLELFRILEAGTALTTWRQGRSPPYGEGTTLWALGEIVKGEAGILETDSADAAANKLAKAVRAVVAARADVVRLEVNLRPLVGLDGGAAAIHDRRAAAFAAWRHFLEALARRRQLVLVFEDTQWADDGLLDFLEHLVDWARDVPLLVLCTARPELLRRRSAWMQRERAETLTLSPLANEDTAELVNGLVDAGALSAEMTRGLVSGAEGNPLYAVEYVRMLTDRGLLDPTEGKEGPVAGAPLPLPESLKSIIAARLDALPADEKKLLQDASVVGRAVWPGALAAIGGQSRRAVERGLRTLEHKEFLARDRRSSVEGEEEFRFRHGLVRDVAYGQLLRRARAEAHRRAADWIESLAADRPLDQAELLAHHYSRALELTGSVGEETADLATRTRLALRSAGEKALALHSYPAAARLFVAALDIWPSDDVDRPKLLFRVGESRFYAEAAGGDLLAEARDRLLESDEREMAAEAESLLGWLAYHRGEHDRRLEHAQRAAALVDGLPPSSSKAWVLSDLAGALILDRPRQAIQLAREGLEIAEALSLDELRASSLGLIGFARGRLGDPEGKRDLERSIAIAEEINSPLSAYGFGNLADLVGSEGDLRRGFQLQAEGRKRAERFGHAAYVRWFEVERIFEAYWSGLWSEAVQRVEHLIAEEDAGSPHFLAGRCREMRARIRHARGDFKGALDDGAKALEFARKAKDLQALCPALAVHARSLLAGGVEEAGRLVDELFALWQERSTAHLWSSWVADLAFALESLERSNEFCAAAEVARQRAPTQWLDAATAFAATRFRSAAKLYGEIGSLPDEAYARLRSAETLAGAGSFEEADAEAAKALAFFREVEASPCIQRAEKVLTSLTRL